MHRGVGALLVHVIVATPENTEVELLAPVQCIGDLILLLVAGDRKKPAEYRLDLLRRKSEGAQ